jgi:hypothetical protein
MTVAYSLTTTTWALLTFVGWIAFIALAIWLLVDLVRNRKVGVVVKAIVIAAIFIFPPLGVVACLVVRYVTKSRRRSTEAGSEQSLESPRTVDDATRLFNDGYVEEAAAGLWTLRQQAVERHDATALQTIDRVAGEMRGHLEGDDRLPEFDAVLRGVARREDDRGAVAPSQ